MNLRVWFWVSYLHVLIYDLLWWHVKYVTRTETKLHNVFLNYKPLKALWPASKIAIQHTPTDVIPTIYPECTYIPSHHKEIGNKHWPECSRSSFVSTNVSSICEIIINNLWTCSTTTCAFLHLCHSGCWLSTSTGPRDDESGDCAESKSLMSQCPWQILKG